MNEDVKTYIRIILVDAKGRQIQYPRNDEYQTSVDDGWEDLNLKEDFEKIELYRTAEYIDLYNNKTYKVTKRIFMPCTPVTLHLYLEEEDK